jgi:CPA2 family monovalent cation:H+ antiporter-2
MLLDIRFVMENIHKLLLAVTLLVAGKAVVMLGVALVSKTPLAAALRTAAQLAQAGEFGLVLIGLAQQLKLISADAFQLTLSAMLLSMFIAPFLIERTARLSSDLGRGDWAHKTKVILDIATHGFTLDQHVIICGYGRTGRRVSDFLSREGIPFLALEVDPQRIAAARALGLNVNFGSADRPEVLKAAGIKRARAVVVTYPDLHSTERVTAVVHGLRPDIPLIVRAPDERNVAGLKAAGATEVISDVLEGSLLMAAETLSQIGIPMERGMVHVREARSKRYASLREFYERSTAKTPKSKAKN